MNYQLICAVLLSYILSVCYANDREKRYIFVNPDAPITLGKNTSILCLKKSNIIQH